jgi:outer membrane scaffolding protein for murein synthesis (MipA/OmpV family)
MAATYVISSNWSASAAVIAGRLEGSAAGSPVTERRLDLNGTMSVAYKF